VYYQITPDVEQDIIVPLAQQLINDQFQISGVLRTLMESLHFYDLDDSQTSNDHQGALIKSPLEITLGLYRTLGLTLPQMQVGQLPLFYQVWMGHTLSTLHGQGLDFYEPYDVAGYDPYYQFPGYNRLWITPNNLAMRYKYGESLLVGVQDANMNVLLQLDPVAFVQQWVSDPTNPDTLLQEILPYFIPIPLNAQRYAFFRDSVLLDTLSAINWAFEWSAYASGGPDTNVRTQLENLFRAMIQCPEFQLM
jgi:hypothetical protein